MLETITDEKILKKKKKTKKNKTNVNDLLKNVSIPKGLELESIDLEKAKFLCSLPKSLGTNPENQKEIILNTGRFGPYLKCENNYSINIVEIFLIIFSFFYFFCFYKYTVSDFLVTNSS